MRYCTTNFTSYENSRIAEKHRGKNEQIFFCKECFKYHSVPARIKNRIKKDRKIKQKAG